MNVVYPFVEGQRFGKLVAVQEAESTVYGQRRWLMRCDCGNERAVRVHDLINGSSASCGCALGRRPHNLPELVGKRFGKLVVMKREGTNRQGSAKWLCACDCGGEKITTSNLLTANHTKSCGCLTRRRGEDNPQFKGGHKAKNGYLCTSVDGKSVLLHRIVMERHLGRKLTKDESVHHINGKRTDNRIENLELWTGKHSSGQRVDEITEFCLEHLSLYSPEYLSPMEREKCGSGT